MRILVLYSVSVSALALAACSGHVSDDVRTRYTERVRQLSLSPVYPPREDLQIGDLYLASDYPGREEHAVSNYVLTDSRMIPLAQAYLDSRIAFAATDDATKVDGKTQESADQISTIDDLTGGKIQTRGRGHSLDSLPIAVFPQVTADAGLDLSSGILAPLQAIGLFGGSSTKVTLGFNDVRTYGVSPLLAEGLAQHMVCARVGSPALATDLDFIRRQAEAEDAAGPVAPFGQRRVQYRVISKIYLTRQITYTYSNVQILALAQRTLAADGSSPSNPAAPTTTVINVNASGASPADAAALNDEIAALQKSVADAGNGFQFGGLSALGLTINRVFKQPVAVAYEGILFDVGDARQIAALKAMCASLPADPGAAGGGGSGTAGGTGSAVGAGTAGASGPTR